MKKHFLRVLMVVLMACLGIGVLAACGDNEEPETPSADPMDGVWTGATVALDDDNEVDFIASVKVVGDNAYAVLEAQNDGDSYYYTKILGKQTDGSYKCVEGYSSDFVVDGDTVVSEQVTYTYTGKLNADNKLVITVPGALMGEDEDVTLNFTARADLPAGNPPTGSLYYIDEPASTELDFTNKKLKMGGEEIAGATFVNVGNYVVIGATKDSQTLAVAVLKKGTKYYLVGFDYDGHVVELTDTAPSADPIDGVWTGAGGFVSEATLTIQVSGDTAHVVEDMGGIGYYYVTFTKGQGGAYIGTMNGASASLSVDEEGQLVLEISMGTSEADNIKQVFPNKAALPAALDITGTKYTTYNGTEATITFGATPAITYDGEPLDNVKTVDVGGFKVFTASMEGADVTAIVYKDGNTNKAYVSLDGENPGAGETCILRDTASTPSTDSIEGVWTGATASGLFGDGNYDCSLMIDLDEDGNGGYALLIADRTNPTTTSGIHCVKFRFPFHITKSDNGDYTGLYDGGKSLIITLAGNEVTAVGFGDKETNVTLTFTEQDELPAPIEDLTGVYYAVTASSISCAVDFDNKKMDIGLGRKSDATFFKIGNYIAMQVEGKEGLEGYAICKTEDGTYQYFDMEGIVHTFTATPVYEVSFQYGSGSHAEDHSWHQASFVKEAGEEIDLSAITPPTPQAGWRFDGWSTKNGKIEGDKYTVKAEDADTAGGCWITLTMTWARTYTTDENVQAQILKWFTGGTLTRTVENGTKVTVEATVTGGINQIYTGLLMDVNMNDDWYRLRMDAAAFTNNGEDSWAKPGTSLARWSANYTSGNIDNYKGMDSAIIVVEAALSNNVLTYTVTVYAATDTTHTTPIFVTTHTVTSTATVIELALNFYYDPTENTSFAVSSAKVTYPTPIAD